MHIIKLKKQVKCKFQKRNRDQKTNTIHHSHFDYEKVPKQDEQVVKMELKGYYT